MKAPELYQQLALFGSVADKHALSKQYRALALGPRGARACAPFGMIKAALDLGLDHEINVDATDFIATLRSLADAEFKMGNDNNALRWTCGPHQRGHFTLMSDSAIEVPDFEYQDEVLDCCLGVEFGEALELGGLACGTGAMRSLGLYGVQLKNIDDKAYAFASDVATLSACCLGPAIQIDAGDGVITLKPEAAAVLASLIRRDGQAFLGSNASSLYCMTPQAELLLNQNAPLRHDIASIMQKFNRSEVKLPLFREAIAAFLKRVDALAAGQNAEVEIAVADGKARLSFSEATGSTEEYYVVQGGPRVTVAPIRLEAHRLAHALAHADYLVFDYISAQNLILRGPSEFAFGISGKPGGVG
jgi:hypothetical protein